MVYPSLSDRHLPLTHIWAPFGPIMMKPILLPLPLLLPGLAWLADGACLVTGDVGPDAVQPLEDACVGVLHARGSGGDGDDEADPDGQPERDEDRLPEPAAQFPVRDKVKENTPSLQGPGFARR